MKIKRLNQRFQAELNLLESRGCCELPAALVDVVKEGLLEEDGCVLLRSLYARSKSVPRSNFLDRTGYECFVNHLHIDVCDAKDGINIGLTFFAAIERLCSDRGVDVPITGILSFDEVGLTVRFHVVRFGERWLCDDLEKYQQEGVAEINVFSPEGGADADR